eukprot:3518399-Rhodomonas_salina.1
MTKAGLGCTLCFAFLAAAAAYPSLMGCNRALAVGTNIMSGPAIAGTESVSLQRGGDSLACGAVVQPGEELAVSFSSTVGQYLLEVEGTAIGTDGAGLTSGTCEMQRLTGAGSSSATVVAPQSGSFLIRAGYASGYGRVSITSDCSYTVGNPDDTPTTTTDDANEDNTGEEAAGGDGASDGEREGAEVEEDAENHGAKLAVTSVWLMAWPLAVWLRVFR